MESCSLPSLRRRLEEESEPETHMPRLDSGDQRTLCGGQLGTIPHLDSQSGTVDETGSNGTQLGNRIAVPPRSTIREPPAWAIRRSSLALFSAARHGDVSRKIARKNRKILFIYTPNSDVRLRPMSDLSAAAAKIGFLCPVLSNAVCKTCVAPLLAPCRTV